MALNMDQKRASFALGQVAWLKEKEEKMGRIANGMADSLLFGLGFGGAAISTVKIVV